FQDQRVTPGDLVGTADRANVLDWIVDRKTEKAKSSAMGKWLQKHEDTPILDKRIRCSEGGHGKVYHLEINARV
ncbi:MAG: hypothetical protein M1457_03795, partial [bacterium]|nr:hypothetical protein [bacterium]